jgi:predicted amidophosphoribosyltransferase
LLRYEGAGRELLARLKYRNARGPVAWLADGMAALAIAVPEEFDVVTWAPTTSARRRARGFDQAEVLARAVGRRVAKPTKPLLVRAPGAPQTGKTAAARRTGPMFSARGAAPERVLLIDDVVTSGATVSAAAFALRAAGTTSVIVITGGRTTLKVHQLPADA